MLKLIELDKEHLETVRSGLQEIKENPTPYDIHIAETAVEYMDKNFDGFLDLLDEQCRENQPEGWVPATTLWLFDEDKFIGLYNIRHRLNEVLTKTGGHIAYQIIPSQRRKGYVKAGLKLVLQWCYENLGLEEVLLSCKTSNIASFKAMTSVMREIGGYQRPDDTINGEIEHSVWIKTKK
ncbi:MAG: GNAT family N-acetyltransferase [Alphaproteobacteria bacterium]|nr:GNAT family N-acetyltransferase [Alphaproteobacteria bacterium]